MSAGSKWLIGVVIVGMCVLAGLAISGNGKSDAARRAATAAEQNTHIVQQTSARTECIRGIAAELDHARWALVAKLVSATTRDDARRIGGLLNGLPLITTLADRGGHILDESVGKCPAAPTLKETP